jgi:hypothetical protein
VWTEGGGDWAAGAPRAGEGREGGRQPLCVEYMHAEVDRGALGGGGQQFDAACCGV